MNENKQPLSDDEMRQHDGSYDPNCTGCTFERDRGNTFYPRHKASDRCESGKRNHCSCDACF